ncbi:MAG: glutamyl-tRNA reductase [Candidatus Hatepunaea meridiana]|nr:glutamyl-tRNA reductase [Candidatus Hatepunaea meridiana]
MPLICCGINHQTGSLTDREPFQLQRSELAQATTDFKRISGLEEVVIIATCNRVEFYCRDSVKTDPRQAVISLYKERGVQDPEQLDEHWFFRQGTSVARHLFKVAAGLDSPLLGEDQVFNQVKDAYSVGCSISGPGRFLHKLFHHAFQIAKQIRTETEIGSGVQGLAGASVEIVRKQFDGKLVGRNVLIVGVNSSTEMLLSRLSRENVNTTVANRTLYTAEKIVRSYNAVAVSLVDFLPTLKTADIIFSVTSTPGFLILPEYFNNNDKAKSIIAVDLAVPRDIDPHVGDIDGITLLDLDDIKGYLDLVQQERSGDIPYALELIEEQVQAYEFWRRNTVSGGNAAMRQILDQDRKDIITRFKDGFRQSDQKALEALSKSLYRQFLRRFNNLKQNGLK